MFVAVTSLLLATLCRPTKHLEAIFIMVYKVRSVLVSFRSRSQDEDSEKTLVGQKSIDTKSELTHGESRGEEMLESPEHSREILDESMDHDSDRERQSVEGEWACWCLIDS